MPYLFLQTAAPDAVNQIESVVNTMSSDNFPKAFGYLCAIIVIIVVFLIIILKIFEHLLSKSEYIKLGIFTIKNKKKQAPIVQENKHEVNMDVFIRILDIIMSTELEKFASEIITATKDIRKIEDNYDDQAHNIFNKTLNSIKTEYHDRLIVVAMNTTGFDLLKIKNTREYLFILDLLRDFEIEWMRCSKDITRRNGFVEFLSDKAKSKDYIEELQDCIFQCIDSRKLDMTDIKRDDIENALKIVNTEMYDSLEKMFTNLANLKKAMLLKRESKLKYIDDTIKNSAIGIISTIKSKVIDNLFVDKSKPENQEIPVKPKHQIDDDDNLE